MKLFKTLAIHALSDIKRSAAPRVLYLIKHSGYVHMVTFSHRFLLFGSKLEFPWDCGTIQSHAKTLPCALYTDIESS